VTQRITKFSVVQTAKVLGVLYALMGLVFVPIFLVAGRMTPGGQAFGMGFALALPIIYGVMGFVFTAIGCALYNMVSGWVGGIEVELG